MRAAIWFLALFGVAVAVALFAGNNEGTVTVFWPPQRIDLSLNLVLFLLTGLFFLLYLALRALSLLLSLPQQARDWRTRRRQHAMHAGMLEALANLNAGRFGRARKSADKVLAQGRSLDWRGQEKSQDVQLSVMVHWLAAESAHALQDRETREAYLQQALALANQQAGTELSEGLQLSAVRWAVEDRDSAQAQERLRELPQGVARRTLAIRLRLQAARLAGQTQQALETARLLAKHKSLSGEAGRGMVRALAQELLHMAHDPEKLQQIWGALDPSERRQPELAIAAAQRLLQLEGKVLLALQWLQPAWEQLAASRPPWPQWSEKLVQLMEQAFSNSEAPPDPEWLKRIEALQQNYPSAPLLQYLAAVACMRSSLWGKAQSLMQQSLGQLKNPEMRRIAWRTLALLAEQRSDDEAAAQAWRHAALE
ncbi:MAG: heme biosynthesis protein HemY [Hylemonella sp.]|jgi:HemY protein